MFLISADNSSVVKAKSESEDLTLAASALTETLFSTEGRHAQRDNYFDLNSGNPNDVAPLDFPGPAFDVTPAGLRQSGANLNEPSTPNSDTSENTDAVEISGVGRPPNPPTTFKPQGGGHTIVESFSKICHFHKSRPAHFRKEEKKRWLFQTPLVCSTM